MRHGSPQEFGLSEKFLSNFSSDPNFFLPELLP